MAKDQEYIGNTQVDTNAGEDAADGGIAEAEPEGLEQEETGDHAVPLDPEDAKKQKKSSDSSSKTTQGKQEEPSKPEKQK